ncbi:MAG: hypothetical protein Q7K42_01540 [Candidatus Diapherotrites archaeon]|nr:hypothetical protein [Candidatus Diapherotrites archaeon]
MPKPRLDFVRVKRKPKLPEPKVERREFPKYEKLISELFGRGIDAFRVIGDEAFLFFPSKLQIESSSKVLTKQFEEEDAKKIAAAGHPLVDRQAKHVFDKDELRDVFHKLLGSPVSGEKNLRLVVFAGYTGQFSKALQGAGFDVVHTDPLNTHVQRTDMPSFQAFAHTIPKIARVSAFVSFEGFPAIEGLHGFPFILRALAESEKGIVVMCSKNTLEFMREKDTGQIHVTSIDLCFNAFKKFYGAEHKSVVTNDNVFIQLHTSPDVRKLAQFDLKMLNYVQNNHSFAAPHLRRVNLPELSEKFNVQRKQIIDSLKRIHSSYFASMVVA